jgi:hypothetical protein
MREPLSLDQNTPIIGCPLLIKGWSSLPIADRLKVSLITIQKLLEIGRKVESSWEEKSGSAPVRIETEREGRRKLQALSLD